MYTHNKFKKMYNMFQYSFTVHNYNTRNVSNQGLYIPSINTPIILFSTAQIFIPQRSAILRKNCLCKHFLQNIVLWSNKRT